MVGSHQAARFSGITAPVAGSLSREEEVMQYDIVIRNGFVIDGSGLDGYRADVGIVGDRIATIGRIAATGEVVYQHGFGRLRREGVKEQRHGFEIQPK